MGVGAFSRRGWGMRIVSLIENERGREGCAWAHGLSLYVESGKRAILVDFGPDGAFLENARRLGIDVGNVDAAFLSHGHYDHAGGMVDFRAANGSAPIYVQKNAFGEHFADDGGSFRFIGVDRNFAALSSVVVLDGDADIGDDISVFTVARRAHALSSTNARILMKKGGALVPDDFSHEQCVVVNSGGARILLSGCAHSGILNIMEEFERKFGGAPDIAISGFHLMRKNGYGDDDVTEVRKIAEALRRYPTSFVTCHCTGLEPFSVMKEIMGEQLSYLRSGEELSVKAVAN